MIIQSLIYYLLWILVFIFSVFLQILIKISNLYMFYKNEEINNRFDYLIVGGGSAGAILAARLSENPNVTVLLIEAGGDVSDILNIPILGPMKQLSDLDWQYNTVPQSWSCFGLNNNASKWPSGKALGGSTHLNYMIYLKGHKHDYLKWKDPHTLHWEYEDISFYYKKALQCFHIGENLKDFCDGKNGSILVRKQMSYTTELSEAILQAASFLNYSLNDLNAETSTGFMKPQLNMDDFGRRWTSDQFLKKCKNKKRNLKILTNAVAEKILFKNGYEAYAVKINRFGKTETFFANLEIIVSAGTVGSAKLLMLSGVGPRNDLIKAGIEPKIDLPVGKNLQDHVTTGLDLILLKKKLFSFTDLMLPSSAYQYFVHGSGPLTSGLVEAVGVVHSALVNPSKDKPDLEFMVMIAGLSSDRGVFFKNTMGISEKVWDAYFSSLVNESVVSILPVLLHPKSIGEVTLDPVNPKGKPKINPKYLSVKEDVNTLVEGIRIIQKMMGTTPMKKFGAEFNRRKFPGCEFLEFDSDEYWGCYVRHLTLTVYHPVGTCKMGNLMEGGVVDFRLRVHRTNKLRVVDASVMPTLPSANTNAAVVMIAEKGADLIKEDFSRRHSLCHIFMSMVKAYNGKKCSEIHLCCSSCSTSNKNHHNRHPLIKDIQMEEDETWSWESSAVCSDDKTESWNEPDSSKFVPLDPPPEFQDNPVLSFSVEKFAMDFVEKLISNALLVSSKISWSIPCSRDCHMSESPSSNNPSSWNGFRLCWTPELLPIKRLSSLSASHNSLSTISSSNLDDSSYIKSAVSHDVLTAKQISDMYNVPFDSDIYAVPVDVVQEKSSDRSRRTHESECYEVTPKSSQKDVRSRTLRSANTSTEPIHVTVEEVRQYLHTLYSHETSNGKKNQEGTKQVKNLLKPLQSSMNGDVQHNSIKIKNNHSLSGKSKKAKENVDVSCGRAEKLKKYRSSFSANLKETLCSLFRIKKLPSPDHCLGRRDVGTRSDEIGMRLSGHEDSNPPSPISKPPFSKRALPPLPKLEDDHGEIIMTDSTPLPSPEEVPPPPPLPCRKKEPSVSIDFASSIEKVKDYGWYWGPISGEAAEKILSHEPDGSFIVRDSSDDYYIFSLTFKLNSIIRHVRIEHDKGKPEAVTLTTESYAGNFSFGSSTRFKSHTIVDFIESAVEHSRSGRYLFFLHRRPILGPMRVQLLHPVSRFKQVQSLQHMCRFVILRMVRKDLIPYLPLPRRILHYLSAQHYYAEDFLDEDRNDSSREDLDQLLPFRQEVFS